MVMMKMNAMESLKDKNMLYLDLLSGITGLILFFLIKNGMNNFSFEKCLIPIIFAVILARVVVDAVYYYTVSKTESFGGSNGEFLWSSLLWFLMVVPYIMYFCNGGVKNSVILYTCTFFSMMALARLTRWA